MVFKNYFLLVFLSLSCIFGILNCEFGDVHRKNINHIVLVHSCISETLSSGRSYSNSNIDISNCFFIRSLSLNDNGGVIFVDGGSYSLKILKSMFCNCTVTDSYSGGAIHFNSYSSNVSMICGYRCHAISNCFAMFMCSHLNLANYVSVTSCSFSNTGDHSFGLYYGIQALGNSNSSMNSPNYNSGVLTYYPSSFEGSFCNFANNRVNNWICLYFYGNSGVLASSNIVHNNSPTEGVVYLQSAVEYTISKCIFTNNRNTLFYRYNAGWLTIIDSHISHTDTLTYGFSIEMTNNIYSFTKSYGISLFRSVYCYADKPINTVQVVSSISKPLTRIREQFIVYLILVQ